MRFPIVFNVSNSKSDLFQWNNLLSLLSVLRPRPSVGLFFLVSVSVYLHQLIYLFQVAHEAEAVFSISHIQIAFRFAKRFCSWKPRASVFVSWFHGANHHNTEEAMLFTCVCVFFLFAYLLFCVLTIITRYISSRRIHHHLW